MSASDISNLVDLLKFRAANQPEKTVYIFLEDGEREQARITYGQLNERAEAIAAFLSSKANPGNSLSERHSQRALLLYPAGLDFITAFFGCLYAGIIAVPAYPPRRNQSLERLQAIAQDAEATLALSTQKVVADVEKSWDEDPLSSNLQWLATDKSLLAANKEFKVSSPSPETLAFLQYTSGSTGTPKGVMVSHGNLIDNSKVIYTCFESSREHIGVSWLPFHHDMGLIGGLLQTLYGGGTVVLMPPVAFLQKPIRWLQAISRYRAVTSGGPNFAYELCAQNARPEQIAELDLSYWSLAFTGAEPVRPETLKKFSKTFEPSGFSNRAFYPCYGMAETTLLVTGGIRAEDPVIYNVDGNALARNQIVPSPSVTEDSNNNKALVGCGHSWFDQKVRIVDPETLTGCAANRIGEIWVAGESVAQGYWGRSQQTQETFQAYTADTGEGPFLRTGDLGFFHNNELFITGRLKDVVIIRGRNHYPQDIELTVENAHEALQVAGAAAFSIEANSAEQLVVVQEVKRPYLRSISDEATVEEIILAIRRAVSEAHELQVYAVQLLKPGSLPKTSSGKVQRKQCKASFLDNSLGSVAKWQRELQIKVPDVDSKLSVELKGLETDEKIQAIETWLIHRIAQRLQISPNEIDRQEPLASYGLDSLQVIEMSNELEVWLKQPVFPTIVYDFPTVEALAKQLVVGEPAQESESPVAIARQIGSTEPIAVVGAGCRFPEAPTLQAFWELLRDGRDAISPVPLSRWDTSKISESKAQWGGFLKQIDQFDAKFFGISPREAVNMDPQQRLLLEVCWETLENAGLSADKLEGSQSGIFIGVSNGDYSRLQGAQINQDVYYGTGNAFSIAANRLSYLFNWHGPSWAIDTACSSSLVAVHQACGSLRSGECNLALAGGVNLILDPQLTVTFSQAQMLSPDGRCKTFDASADGYVRSEGCGMVALKRLSDARRDGDIILGLIQGSAVNQDGRSNGLTAPNSLAQQSAIRQALANADVDNGQVDYIEAHGTGTSLGDPIEVNALKAVFTKERTEDGSAPRPCWLGSVKTNIGHLEPAAGIAGLIKVLLSLQHEEIPPHLHLQKINPYIQLEDSPLQIPTERQKWEKREQPRIAGISSFGFGGTNAHVIVSDELIERDEESADYLDDGDLEEASALERPLHLLALSAKSEEALEQMISRYQDFLQSDNNIRVEALCFTANVGRSHFNHRLAIQTNSIEQLQKKLRSLSSGSKAIGVIKAQISHKKPPEVTFLFTGQGSQYIDMGRQLYESQPTFRKAIERCDAILRPVLDCSLISALYPHNDERDSALLDRTAYTQPALFSVEYALAQLWQSWGIEPDVVLGHSVGEYAAACIAGVFSLEDGLTLIAERGRLMQALPAGGQMLSVLASVSQVEELIAPYEQMAIAAINGPQSVVVSGDGEEVEAIARQLQAQDIKHKKLTVSHAFHSPLMEPMLEDFVSVAKKVNYSLPKVSFISCLTGEPVDSEIASADYWVSHVQQPVKFAAGISTLQKQGHRLYIEIGPKPLLLGMTKQAIPLEVQSQIHSLPSLRPGQADWPQLLQSLSQLYALGVDIDWAGFDEGYSRHKVMLPTYPFQRQRYWTQTDETHTIGQRSELARSKNSVLHNKSLHKNTNHPLTGQQLYSPVPPTQFQSQVSVQQPAYLDHHRVYGQAIMPAAAYLEIALSAGKVACTSPIVLANVAIQRGLIFSELQLEAATRDTSQTLQTVLLPTSDGAYQFQIFSIETDSTNSTNSAKEQTEPRWICHATGDIRPVENASLSPVDLDACKADFQQQIPIDIYYQTLHQNGLEYGEDFRSIRQLWAAPNRALGEISLPETVLEDPFTDNSLYTLHPVLLDASFQILAAAVGETSDEETYLPVGIEKLSVYGSVPDTLWALGSVSSSTNNASKQLIGHVRLLSEKGEVIAEVEGLKLNRTNREMLLRYLRPVTPPALYKLSWVESSHTATSKPAAPEPLLPVVPLLPPEPSLPIDSGSTESLELLERWLVFSDGEVGTQLVEQLQAKGDRCIVISPGQDYQHIDNCHYQLDPASVQDVQRLITSVLEQSIQIKGILHLWSALLKGVDNIEESVSISCASMLHLIQALVNARVSAPLWLITQGAQSVDDSEVQISQTPLWGLGRAIALEHPELNCRRIDIPSTDSGILPQLVEEIVAPNQEDQIVYRQSDLSERSYQRYVARLSPFDDADDESLAVPAGESFQLKLKEYGLLDNLTLQPVSRKVVSARDVEIQVAAAGLNFRDVLNALGLLKEYYAKYLGITQASQLTFGFECAGTVVAVGDEVSHLQVGDEVIATMLTDGASRFVTTRSEFVIPKPKQMSFAEAATLPLAFLTAYYGLEHLAALQPGDKVLIHAAAGGVGQAAVQVAQRAGAEIFATASPGKCDFLKAQGIHYVMNSRNLDFADEVMALTKGRGVDVVLNSLNGDFIDKSFEVLAEGGRFVELGKIGIWDEQKVKENCPTAQYFPFDLGEVTKANPELIRDLWMELGDRFDQSQFTALPIKTFPVSQSVQAFRYMQQAKHIGKVVLTFPTEPANTTVSIGEEGCYLISGGLGALGLKVAQWIVEQGGRHVVLVGRRSPSGTAQRAIAQMESNGAQVSVKLGDISQRSSVRNIINQLNDEEVSLKGIIHAAGVLEDGLLSQLSWQQFSYVMAPKVSGAWHLHELTQNLPLDFFVCFSSIASLLGSPGQGNYAAANAFMDGLMHHRRTLGLPGVSINWGPWADVGMAAQLGTTAQDRLKARGVNPIEPSHGLSILSDLLSQSVAQVGAFSIDWLKFTAQLPPGVELPVLERFQTSAESEMEGYLQGLEQLKKVPVGERRSHLITHIQTEIADVLGYDSPDEIALDQPLADLGVDSLMAVELANQLEHNLGPTIPASFLFEHPTLEGLVSYLIEQMPSVEFLEEG